MAKVTIIPATIHPITHKSTSNDVKRRTAAYARVSTEYDEQASSYEAQVDYYTRYIKSRSDLEFVDIYTDEGITGTSTKKRTGFMNMINDALAGKIDFIITKSISRFARNTLDTLTYIRKLKDKGIEIFFEKENIYTLDSKGELLVTIMASLAQEESRSISENVTWGQRKSFKDGNVHLAYSHFLGYTKGEDGKLKIVPEEAETIKLIYSRYLEGKTSLEIANELTSLGIKTPFGLDKWKRTTVDSILKNEKYKGEAILQKTYTKDFLNHKLVKNNGEVDKIYIPDSHQGIILKDEWDQVQYEMAKRKKLGTKYSAKNEFLCKLFCGDCGSLYGSKTWHSTDKYKSNIYQCNHKYQKDKPNCKTPTLKEEVIKTKFIEAYNEFMVDRTSVIEDCILAKELISNTTELESRISELTDEYEFVIGAVNNMVAENSNKVLDQDEYLSKYERYEKKYNELVIQIEEAKNEKARKELQAKEMEAFILDLETRTNYLEEWDKDLWNRYIERATVNQDGSITFKFVNGTEVIK